MELSEAAPYFIVNAKDYSVRRTSVFAPENEIIVVAPLVKFCLKESEGGRTPESSLHSRRTTPAEA